MITNQELMRRIRAGEDGTLELKRVELSGSRVKSPQRNGFADELAAMANGWGGIAVLGVEDTSRSARGIPIDQIDTVESWVREICNDSLVLCVEVDRSLFVHGSPGGYFRRIGSSRREMQPELLARLFQERSQSRVIRFDESPVPRTGLDSLNAQLTDRFLREGQERNESSLGKLRIMAKDDEGELRVTLGGVLLCTRNPGQWLPHAQIQAVSYAGERTDVNYQNDARDIAGPIDQQILDALHFVRRNMRVAATKHLGRVDIPQFSERAVFEALVNAVAHRDYTMAGARIRLHMFADRLELYVPGGLANTLTSDSLDLRQYSRNELIVSLLARLEIDEDQQLQRSHFMDRRGDGVPIILKESHDLSGKKPEYQLIDDSELRLMIWAAEPPRVA